MRTREDLVKIIRRSQTFISIMLFLAVFLFSWHVTGFEITEIQLSKWGESGSTVEKIWNTVVCVLSLSIGVNAVLYIHANNRVHYKKFLYCIFVFVSLCLLTLGIFNVDHHFMHNLGAYLFFFTYPLSIFIFAHLNRKTLHYKDWVHHVAISISMVVLPLIIILLFNGMALAETAHIIFVMVWNMKIAFK